jgi:hypothetical protein
MRGAGMAGQMGLIGMLGLGGMEAQDLAPMMALSGASGAGGGSSGTGGGFDPTMLMLLSQTGGGLGGGLGEMLPLLMLSQSMNQRQQPMAAPALNPMAAQLLKMLGSTGTNITPGQQSILWSALSMKNKLQDLMRAVSNPELKIKLENSGLVPNLNTYYKLTACPAISLSQCPLALCENRKMLHTPESFYMCKGCPTCPLDAKQRKMLDMMKMMNPGQGGAGAVAGLSMPSSALAGLGAPSGTLAGLDTSSSAVAALGQGTSAATGLTAGAMAESSVPAGYQSLMMTAGK